MNVKERCDSMVLKLTVMAALLLHIAGINSPVFCAELTVADILQHADKARGNSDGIVWDIKISSIEEGSGESRGLTVKVKKNNVLAKYTSPPNLNDRMVLMVDKNMWFIRSGLSKPVSISPRQKLLGDAANGDIASTNYGADYQAKLLGEESIHGEPCYVLDLKAARKDVTYDKIKYWVSRDRLVGVKAEFYTLSGKLFKTGEFKYENKVTMDDKTEIPFVSELIIRDAIRTNKTTVLSYSNIRLQAVPDSAFNLNVLIR
jgi:hypothetical protein